MPTTLKTAMQHCLKSLGIYHRMKSSRLYDAYWLAVDRRVLDGRRAEVEFYLRHLEGFRPGDLIFDIGANEGFKAGIFLRMGARVVAVEPDAQSQAALTSSFHAYRLNKRPLTIVGKAASDRDAVETLWIDAAGSAKNTLSSKWVDVLRNDEHRFGQRLHFRSQRIVETIRVETLIATYGVPFFIKIDVEGHEPQVIRGLQRPVPYVSFEVNLPEFRTEGVECIELLSELAADGRFNYSPDCRRGLGLERWVEKREFLSTFAACTDESLEVFWKAPARVRLDADAR